MALLAGSAACSPVFTDAVRWFNSPLAHPHSPRNTGHSALPADRLCPAMSHRPLRRPGFTVGSSDPPCPYTLPSRALAGVPARSPSQPGHRRDGWRRPSFPCRQTLIPLVSAHETLAHAENRKHGRRIGMRQFGYCLGEGGARRGAVARAAECESSLRPIWATPINARRDDHGECRSSAAVPSLGRPRSPTTERTVLTAGLSACRCSARLSLLRSSFSDARVEERIAGGVRQVGTSTTMRRWRLNPGDEVQPRRKRR